MDEEMIKNLDNDSAIAYVDGSYDVKSQRFSYGVVMFTSEEETHISRAFSNPELALMRNVAGEIMGAGEAMKRARKGNIKHLTIYHDYEGIAKWCTGEWKTNKKWTKKYKAFYDEISKDVEINFVKVTGHSGNRYNEMADRLAKEALGIK